MESAAIFEHFPGFFCHKFTICRILKPLGNLLVSFTDAIKARNKQAAKEKLYISLLYLNPDKLPL